MRLDLNETMRDPSPVAIHKENISFFGPNLNALPHIVKIARKRAPSGCKVGTANAEMATNCDLVEACRDRFKKVVAQV